MGGNMGLIDYTNSEVFAYPKPPKTEKKKRKVINGKKHRQTKETDIDVKTKLQVWERDNHQCIFCDTKVSWHYANAHFVPRSLGGLGIVQNIFTACEKCHQEQDNGLNTEYYDNKARKHLQSIYGKGWNENLLIYKKYNY